MLRVIARSFHVSVAARFPRGMSRTMEEFQQSVETPPQVKGNFVRVAFIGDPNVGKSTIINKLLNLDICSVSEKAHTTRETTAVATTSDNLQMVLVDTPGSVHGIHARKHKLPDEMVIAPKQALNEKIDVLATVIDAADQFRRDYLTKELKILLHKHRIENPNACSILVLNKVDKVKSKKHLLSCIDTLCDGNVQKRESGNNKPKKIDLKAKIWEREESRLIKQSTVNSETHEIAEVEKLEFSPANPDPGTFREEFRPRCESWSHFERVFLISAKEKDGLDDLKQFLLSRAQMSDWVYRTEYVSSNNPIKLTQQIVRSKLLDNLPLEIPYVVTPKVASWNVDESGTLHVDVSIECKSEREVKFVLGTGGQTMQKITQQTRQQMCDVFQCEIALKIVVVNKNAKPKK